MFFWDQSMALLLMDDTVLLATSRKADTKVQNSARIYGMSINISKTKFMVINNDENDKATILSNGLSVKYCPVYIYLGAFITDDASSRHSIELHVESKRKYVLKFASFLNRNPGLPFVLKRRVAEACVLSTLLYGCESWLYNSYCKLNSLYMNMIKLLSPHQQKMENPPPPPPPPKAESPPSKKIFWGGGGGSLPTLNVCVPACSCALTTKHNTTHDTHKLNLKKEMLFCFEETNVSQKEINVLLACSCVLTN